MKQHPHILKKKKEYGNTEFAIKFKNDFVTKVENSIINPKQYKVKSSVGGGNWANIPWIAIFDKLITESAQDGYYPVYLFREDMSGFYLSLNQGVTKVAKTYKKNKRQVLKVRAENFRAKLNVREDFSLQEINLRISNSQQSSKLYEFGNIYAKYYDSRNIPNDQALVEDLNYILNLYQELIYNDNDEIQDISSKIFEIKKLKYHLRVERNSRISKLVKDKKGYICEACSFDFENKYGSLGKDYIEAHHLSPISTLEPGKIEMDLVDDFAVLCSNCHRMIHRLDNPSNLEELKKMIKNCNKTTTLSSSQSSVQSFSHNSHLEKSVEP
ncbi:MrcB family domain-containing protein [Epilithonimonas zeae]|uniref:MrcB family domain-containing protein n=1 Tax=Epilithonimonas zeae TaxID=1416779 RepID=UPI00200EDC6D|nr:DUF3578 domain-containing protein [Epilithonimonas zeae]UQB70067.1 DUF3578 domain-containing protein [Epilithonimonas zeae]